MAYIVTEKAKQRYEMTSEERATREATKAIHGKLREPLKGGRSGDRYDLLAWAFVRGLPFRRCERSHRIQTCGGKPADRYGRPVAEGAAPHEHNLPSVYGIWTKLIAAGAIGGTVNKYGHANGLPNAPEYLAIEAWLADPSGAIPAPEPKPKKPYVPKLETLAAAKVA